MANESGVLVRCPSCAKPYRVPPCGMGRLITCLNSSHRYYDGRPFDFCPLGSMAVDPTWFTANVQGLVRVISDKSQFELMPILADALEDGGCTNAAILQHCRSNEASAGVLGSPFAGRTEEVALASARRTARTLDGIMKIRPLHSWDIKPTEAAALQRQLAGHIDVRTPLTRWELVAGADISYNRFSPTINVAVVVIRASDGTIVEKSFRKPDSRTSLASFPSRKARPCWKPLDGSRPNPMSSWSMARPWRIRGASVWAVTWDCGWIGPAWAAPRAGSSARSRNRAAGRARSRL
jgi:hypothetical protein